MNPHQLRRVLTRETTRHTELSAQAEQLRAAIARVGEADAVQIRSDIAGIEAELIQVTKDIASTQRRLLEAGNQRRGCGAFSALN